MRRLYTPCYDLLFAQALFQLLNRLYRTCKYAGCHSINNCQVDLFTEIWLRSFFR